MGKVDHPKPLNRDRDQERVRWNQALASGDPDLIEKVRVELLVAVHTRIMNDDPTYRSAGWK